MTGGAGFLGSHLVDLLLDRGHKVIAIDNLVTGSVENIAHLAMPDPFETYAGSIGELFEPAPALQNIVCNLPKT